MKGSFSEEALRAYSELAAEKQGLDFAEGGTYDFTRCVRPDGSTYGTGGRCRKGTETAPKDKHPFKAAVTQGRFNLPHSGHAKLIAHLLEKAPVAHVVLGKGPNNVDRDFRAQMLRAVLRKEGVDLSRVKFIQGSNAPDILKDLAAKVGKENVLFMLGADQEKFLKSMGKSTGVNTAEVPRTGEGASSSRIRKMIDSGDTKGLAKEFKNDPYLMRLAKIARKVERNEFNESLEFTRCVKPDGTAYGTKGQCKSGSPKEETEEKRKRVAQIGVPIPEGESAEDVLQRLLPKGAVVHRPAQSA